MSCYWVYGTLGAGKGIFFAKKMQDYLRRGSRVATNVQVFPERLSPNFNTPITRLPDIPRLEDIIALGRGAPYGEKKKLGGLFLDETSIFLNSRDWNDKDRPKWIAYLRLIRKKGWDIYLATQDPESVDKQILKGLGEEFICCTRKDHFRLGVFSDLYDIYKIIKSKGTETESKILPHINSAGYRRGKKTQGNKNYRSEMYRPTQYFGTYDTNQLFQIKYEHLNGRDVDMRAPYTLLPGVTLRKYQLIRDKYYPDVVLPDYENTEEDEELEPEMKIQLDEIKLPKEKPPFPKFQLLFFLLFVGLAVYFFQSAFADEEVIVETPAPEVVTQTSQPTQETKQVLVPSVPDYLQGVYISGYVLWRKDDGSLTYDYALHDRYHRSFDYSYYAITVTPTSPCLAWLTTQDNKTIQVTCALAPPDEKPNAVPSNPMQDMSLVNMATNAIEAF